MRKAVRPYAWLFVFAAFVVGSVPVRADGTGSHERLIVRHSKPYDSFAAAVRNMGGEVTHRYENVDALAVTVPKERLADVMALAGLNKVYKDVLVTIPRPVAEVGDSPRPKGAPNVALNGRLLQSVDAAGMARLATQLPADYLFNNDLIKASNLHAQGNFGQGIIVAVIDSGTANNALVVPSLDGTVIGGESFVPTDPVLSPTSTLNGDHGTEVGTVIAGHGLFVFANTEVFVQSLQIHAPNSVIPCQTPPTNFLCATTESVVPLVGVAPLASIYALKVFPSTSNSTSESIIIAAMDRAITLRRNFNNGVPSVPLTGDGSENNPFQFDSLKIDVVNMSLGGATLFAGRDLEDELTVQMLREGITLATAAGNEGFAAMTGGSPGTGFGSLTVGAASTPAHERILQDNIPPADGGFLGLGVLYRPFNKIQTAFFSSRGPTADGRFDPDLIANGWGTFAQGANGGLSLVSGTSFSCPTVAGAAALLKFGAPSATATQVRNALIQGANPHVLGDRSGRIDQGKGFLDVRKALKLLKHHHVSHRIFGSRPDDRVVENIEDLGFRPVRFRHNTFSAHVKKLRPGQVAQFFLEAENRTDQFSVSLQNITPELPPSEQNQLFTDDILLNIVDSPTSFGRTREFRFVGTDSTFPVVNPQPGLVRVALQGDWTNAGRISADVVIERTKGAQGPPTASGEIHQGDLIPVLVNVPAGVSQLVFELSARENWSRYPTDDLDLILFAPSSSTPNTDGVTLDSPERAVINNPAAGAWFALVDGFTVHGAVAHWQLRATADGVRLP